MRISILGNSVPLLVSPFRRNENDKTYGELLRDLGHDVQVKARQSSMISDLYKTLEEDCLCLFPDYVILNFGIVECTYRTRSRKFQSMLNGNSWKNTIINQKFTQKNSRYFFHLVKKIFKPFDFLFHKILFHYRWLPPKSFSFVLYDIIRSILKDTNVKKIILIGILDCNDWLERISRNTKNSINTYNNILQLCSNDIEGVEYIRPLLGSSRNEISDDGIHFTAKGHVLLSEKINEIISSTNKKNYDAWKNINPNTRRIIIPKG